MQWGIFAIAAATLLLQVAFIRIFSAAIWYHFAFLVVSVALFGFGASGVALSLWPRHPGTTSSRTVAPLGFAISTLVAYLGTNAIPFSPFQILQKPVQVLYFLLYDLLLMVPFFCSGATVALVLREWPARAARLYAFDLIGAACGTLLLFLTLPILGARGVIALAAALGALAALLLASRPRPRLVAAGVLLALTPFVLVPGLLPDVRLDATKGLSQELRAGARLAFSRWSPLARIDVFERPGARPTILIDAAAATPITEPQSEAVARTELSAVGYRLANRPSVAVIGSGGGVDVQNALALGASDVTAIEINPVIIDLVTHRYRYAVGGVFDDPRVHLVRDEGRSYIQRSRRRFDVIQITLIDTWAASVSGAYSLSENYLYTTEAMASYLSHLTPDGCVSITRWYYEIPRLVSLARAALESMGIQDVSRHIAVVNRKQRSVVIVRREPFTEREAVALRAIAAESGYLLQHDPLEPARGGFLDALLTVPDLRTMIANSGIELQPVSDESPFFFQMTRWSAVRLDALKKFSGRGFLEPLAIPVAQIALLTALVLGLVLSVVLLAIPIQMRAVPREGRWRWLAYFMALGVAYIVVEVVLMQRLALLLGHPTYSVTAVLFTILLFSGLGSAWCDRRQGTVSEIAKVVAWGLPVGIVFVAFGVPPLVHATIGLPLAARLAIAVAIVAPIAFLMGVPFPLGVRVLAARGGGHIPWAWAANGCGSVLGSVGAVLGAMLWSYGATLMVAGVVYAAAVFLLFRARERLL